MKNFSNFEYYIMDALTIKNIKKSEYKEISVSIEMHIYFYRHFFPYSGNSTIICLNKFNIVVKPIYFKFGAKSTLFFKFYYYGQYYDEFKHYYILTNDKFVFKDHKFTKHDKYFECANCYKKMTEIQNSDLKNLNCNECLIKTIIE